MYEYFFIKEKNILFVHSFETNHPQYLFIHSTEFNRSQYIFIHGILASKVSLHSQFPLVPVSTHVLFSTSSILRFFYCTSTILCIPSSQLSPHLQYSFISNIYSSIVSLVSLHPQNLLIPNMYASLVSPHPSYIPAQVFPHPLVSSYPVCPFSPNKY